MAFHALADYQNHVIGWLQWEQSSLGDGAVVRFPRIWMSSGECRLRQVEDLLVERGIDVCHDGTFLVEPLRSDVCQRDQAAGRLAQLVEL